jgi:hypothetical protein
MDETPVVTQAINDSIRESRIVHLAVAQMDEPDYRRAMADLEHRAADWVAADELEYWGQDEDGDEWRIHLERR